MLRAVRLVCVLGVFVLSLFLDAHAVQAVNVKRVRHASGSDYTRVVIDLDGPARYRAAFLASDPAHKVPARFFLDISSVLLDPRMPRQSWIRDKRVSRVRSGQYDESTVRVVMDLASPVAPHVFTLDSPPRIVIDLSGGADAAATGNRIPESVGEVPRAPAAGKRPLRAKSRFTIVIDPGHGGKDPGAATRGGGLAEKELVLDLARRVASKLESRLQAKVLLTRNSDRYVTLARRKDLANRADADIFVSIHANASVDARARGVETYYLKNTDDRATLRLARLENGVNPLMKGGDVSEDADLPYILSDMVQGYKEGDSVLLARHIQRELVRRLGTRYKSVKDLGVKQGPFYVLDGTYMPSVLVETAFVSNPEEALRLRSSSYRENIAEGIYRGIAGYLEDQRIAGVY